MQRTLFLSMLIPKAINANDRRPAQAAAAEAQRWSRPAVVHVHLYVMPRFYGRFSNQLYTPALQHDTLRCHVRAAAYTVSRDSGEGVLPQVSDSSSHQTCWQRVARVVV
jgi:hypothetical protein